MSCLIFGVVYAQSSTFFTKQGATMDRKIGKHFEIPAASLQGFISLSIILVLPVYDRIFVPIARNLTGNERGITFLQRIGIGMFVYILSMFVAALAEIRRIKAAKDNGLIDMPEATIPLSISLLLPQYILFGIGDVFTIVGLQEYFYDQMPDTMKTLGIAVYLSVLGVGSFLSSILIAVTEKISCRSKGGCWFTNNLNKAHLDYFYWLLASLSAINFCIYMFLASRYKYKNAQNYISHQEESSCRA
jgi:peptide/histidine transporter 3/4